MDISFTDCWCQLFACSSISAKCEEDLQMKIHIVHFLVIITRWCSPVTTLYIYQKNNN